MTVITNLHLLTFVDRLDSIRENLHLRTLTDREVQEIIEGGFTTLTSGVYNPIYSKPKWRNTKEQNYITEQFVIHNNTPLTVLTVKSRSKKIRLPVKQDFSIRTRFFTNVMKSCLPSKNKQKLHLLLENTRQITQKLKIYTALSSIIHTPINVKTWVKENILTIYGIDPTKVPDSSYIYDDVGDVGDIEMIEIIKELELVRDL